MGAATSTGVGEEVIRNCGSFLVVELMRQGRSPREACREAVQRILKRQVVHDPDFQVGFLAISKAGEVGAYAVQKGFSYAVCDAASQTRIVRARASREPHPPGDLSRQSGGPGRGGCRRRGPHRALRALDAEGLTPAPGLMAQAGACGVPIFALIRSRAGDFVFGARDLDAMRRDIDAARAAGLAGVVLGAAGPTGGWTGGAGRPDRPRRRASASPCTGPSM